MEGVPRISMMSFPMRKSVNAPQFRNTLKSYIFNEYKEDGDSYTNEIHDLESLRAGAIHVTKDFSGCATLKKYFCQLNFLRTRFPIVQGGPCEILFSWFDAFSESECSRSDVEFEMSTILYNIGALHSELGAIDNRQTPEGMKNACTHFQCAAWAFQHFRHNYQTWFTPDLSPDTLSIMINICLAQAQECILEKSLIDNRKSTITAKVALQIVEYYQLAMKTCDQMLKDAGVYPDKLLKAVKKWKKLIELKCHYYGCISLLYRGMQAEDENKYGERVAFYKGALEKLSEAAKCAKGLDKSENVHDTVQFTFDVVQGKVQISEKENEFIYHEKVPELSALSSDVKGVSLVKGIPFKFDDPQISGPDIFGRLVPIQAHEESSMYSEDKAKLLRHYSAKIEAKNEALDKMIIALQLDQIDLHSAIKKIPQELVDCCAALSVNKDAVKVLSDAMAKLSGMYHDVEGNLSEIEDLLKEEEVKEKEHQQIMGIKRPPSNVVVEYAKEMQKYRSAQSVAAETNQTLHDALSKHVGNLHILMKPFDEAMKHIPMLEEDDQADQESIAQMKKLIGKVDEMRKQRLALENQLRESIHNDDITSKIVIRKGDTDIKELFNEELKKHETITQILDQNLLAQDNIIRALTEANANYAETRQKTVQAMKRRDKVIEDMLSSYECYDELMNKCNKGIEFYTKLDTNVQKLLQRVRSVRRTREEERESSMRSLFSKTKNLSLNMPPAVGVGMNMGYMPPTGVPVPSMPSSNAFPPSSGGHMKLKDYLDMRKAQQQIDKPQLPAAPPTQPPPEQQPHQQGIAPYPQTSSQYTYPPTPPAPTSMTGPTPVPTQVASAYQAVPSSMPMSAGVGMNMGYMPQTGVSVPLMPSSNAFPPSSGGHIKLKDYLDMRKAQQIDKPPAPPPMGYQYQPVLQPQAPAPPPIELQHQLVQQPQPPAPPTELQYQPVQQPRAAPQIELQHQPAQQPQPTPPMQQYNSNESFSGAYVQKQFGYTPTTKAEGPTSYLMESRYQQPPASSNYQQQQQYPPSSSNYQQQQQYPPSSSNYQQQQQYTPSSSNYQQQQQYPPSSSNYQQQQQYPPSSSNYQQQQQYPPSSSNYQQQQYPPYSSNGTSYPNQQYIQQQQGYNSQPSSANGTAYQQSYQPNTQHHTIPASQPTDPQISSSNDLPSNLDPAVPPREPQQQPTPPPMQEYNPSESFLAKYVKQHLGSTPTTKSEGPTSYLIGSRFQQPPSSNYQQQVQYPPSSSNGTSYPNQQYSQQQGYYNQPSSANGTTYQHSYQPNTQHQGYYDNTNTNPTTQTQTTPSGPPKSSSIDLLSDLDFNLSQPPLEPTPPSNPNPP